MPLSSTTSAPDSSLREQGSHYPSGPGVSHIDARLLQLTSSRSATVHAGTSSTRPGRHSTSGVRAGRKRSRHRQSDTVALATSPLAHPVQTVLHNAFCFYGNCPVYLTNIVRTVTTACCRSGLRSTSSSMSRFGEHSFSHAGLSAWNALPSDIRAVGDTKAFRHAVKTHYTYFSLAFWVF